MSSVSPSSSASNEAKSSNVVGFDVVACLEEIRKAMEGGCLSAQDGALLMKQVFPAYQAYLRKSAVMSASPSVSSPSSSVQSSVGTAVSSSGNSSGGRYSALRNLSTWRPSRGFPSGFCYLEAVKRDRREDVSVKLGPSPSLFSLMALDVSDVDIADSKFLSLVGKPQLAHLRRVSTGEGNFLAQMASVAARNVPALSSSSTFWHYLRSRDGEPTQFLGSTSVGQGIAPLDLSVREEVRLLFSAVLPERLGDMVVRFSKYRPVSGFGNVYLSDRCDDKTLIWETPSEWFVEDMIEVQLLEISCAKVRRGHEILRVPDVVSYVQDRASRRSLESFPMADKVERHFALVGDVARAGVLAAVNNWLIVSKAPGVVVVDICPQVGDSDVVRVAARWFEDGLLSGSVIHDGVRGDFASRGLLGSGSVSVDEGDKFSFVDV